MQTLIVAVIGLLAIAASASLATRVRVASPLILVVAGIAVSFLPIIPNFEIDPEWILAGVLPPLLYSASVSIPTMNFRREFTAIAGLSVALVVLSSVVLGFFFAAIIPGLGIWWGIALGAIVSPTDAVATSIVRRVGVTGRVVSVLEGESLLNDATALVLLRAAIAGTAASVSLWGVVGNFAYAVAVAVVLGVVVGWLNLRVRARITDSTVNTVVSFTVPFLASIPAELLGASGLVAAVVAGLVTGHGAARRLSPQHRLSDSQNWRTVELVLEGLIFLVMGLELSGILTDVMQEHSGAVAAFGVAAGAFVLTIVVRAGYIAALLGGLRRRGRRRAATKPRLDQFKDRLDEYTQRIDEGAEPAESVAAAVFGPPGTPPDAPPDTSAGAGSGMSGGEDVTIEPPAGAPLGLAGLGPSTLTPADARLANLGHESAGSVNPGPGNLGPGSLVPRSLVPGGGGPGGGAPGRAAPSPERAERAKTRTIRMLADIDYYLAAPLGWREGGLLVWAGMRGAVTVAAAQTLPTDTPNRSLLILIAFVVAAGSLIIQGGTLSAFVSWIKPATPDTAAEDDERGAIIDLMRECAEEVKHEHPHGDPRQMSIDIIVAQRTALLDASDDGVFSAETLNGALINLDAMQISIEMRGRKAEEPDEAAEAAEAD